MRPRPARPQAHRTIRNTARRFGVCGAGLSQHLFTTALANLNAELRIVVARLDFNFNMRNLRGGIQFARRVSTRDKPGRRTSEAMGGGGVIGGIRCCDSAARFRSTSSWLRICSACIPKSRLWASSAATRDRMTAFSRSSHEAPAVRISTANPAAICKAGFHDAMPANRPRQPDPLAARCRNFDSAATLASALAQSGFSSADRRTRLRISSVICGLPPRGRERHRQ